MKAKAKLYRDMKRGEFIGDNEALVDFDRKWAEQGEGGSSSSSEDEGNTKAEIVEYEDEYGRLRKGTQAEADRMERRKQNKVLGQEELDRMSARPAMPSKLIHGDTVQTLAFNPDAPIADRMEELAKRRDRSMTPPEMKHYEADKEFRIKGVGFYAFSKEEEVRKREMEALGREREETERIRREREAKKEARRKEVEERRRVLGEKRAKKQAESFLDGLGDELGKEEN